MKARIRAALDSSAGATRLGNARKRAQLRRKLGGGARSHAAQVYCESAGCEYCRELDRWLSLPSFRTVNWEEEDIPGLLQSSWVAFEAAMWERYPFTGSIVKDLKNSKTVLFSSRWKHGSFTL